MVIHRFAQFALAVALLPLAGCARYEAKPITSEAIEPQLAPTDDVIQLSASQLKHSSLKPVTIDLRDGLTPDEAGVVAVIVNPNLRAERDARGVAAAQLLQAGLLPNPQFVGGLDFPYQSSPPDDFTAYTAGLEWEVTSLITHDAKVRAARAQVASVRLDIAWKEWLVAQQARAAAFDVLALEAQLKAARQASEQLTENVNVVSRAVDRHDKTLVDLAAADATAQDAQAAAITQARDLAHQRLTLNRAMGLPAGRTLRLRGGDDVPTRLQPPPLADLLRELEPRRLDLLALKRGYESQDETLREAILAQFPKVSLGFNAARDTSNVKTIGLGVTIDIPIFDRNQGAIANETATRQKLFDEYAARLFEARSDIATAIADIEGTNEQIAAAESALPKLERLAAIYEAELKQGNVDILSSYAARTAVWQKRIDVLKLRQQLMQNRIALEIAAGQILPMQASTAPTTRESK